MHGIFVQTFSITGNWGLWVTPAALRVLDAFFCFFFFFFWLFLRNYGEPFPAQSNTTLERIPSGGSQHRATVAFQEFETPSYDYVILCR